jgi:DnaJ family protein C protein 1
MGTYLYIWLILSSFIIKNAQAWDGDELELFDLVEEINRNFYELLGISKVRITH